MHLASPAEQKTILPSSRVNVDVGPSYHDDIVSNESLDGDDADVSPDRSRAIGIATVCLAAFLLAIPFALSASNDAIGGAELPLAGTSNALANLLPLEGHKKESHKKKTLVANTACEEDTNYSKHTVKTAYELPFAALFKDNKGQKKFEASSVTIVDDTVYSVCDSSWAIAKFTSALQPFSVENVQIGDPNKISGEDSGYEAIFHHAGMFYVVRESILHDDEDSPKHESAGASYHAVVQELDLGQDDYTLVSECSSEFEFEGDSKGFEGAVGFPDEAGELYIIGLCEGNYCSESRKDDTGNGRTVLMKKKEGEDVPHGCMWETVGLIKVPTSANFRDYSAMDITDSGRVAITSQEDSSLWLGQVKGIKDGIIDPEAFEFEEEIGKTHQFAKTSDCHTQYCNVEGIHFMNDEMLMGVSDKMKSRGKQDFRCLEKDQSIHAFVLP